MTDESDEQDMGIDMSFQAVDFCLVVVAEIAHSPCALPKGDVKGKHLAEGRCSVRSGDDDIMIIVALREDLIVRLSIVGTEHDTQEGNAELIANSDGHLANMKPIGGSTGRQDIQGNPCLERIVSIAGVIDETKVGIRYGTRLELKPSSEKLPVVMVSILECIETGDFPTFPCSVVGIGHIATVHNLLGEMATLFFSRGMGYIPYLLSSIFLWREIGI